MVEARSMTAECCNRRACSCGVKTGAGTGDAGVMFEEELRFKFSIAGKEVFVEALLRGTVTAL